MSDVIIEKKKERIPFIEIKMKKEYDTFVNSLQDIPQGQEVALVIRDLTPGTHKYEARHVKAIVSSSPAQLPDGDTLWIRFDRGSFSHPEPWAIKVLAELSEYLDMPPEGWGR